MSVFPLRSLLPFGLLLLLIGCAQPSVVRVVDGHELEGRYISSYAYTLYAIAADAEAHGDAATALDMFEAAANEDEDSPEIWTRIGALRCRLGRRGGPEAEAFSRARDLDPESEPLHREEAQCALAKGQIKAALALAARAVELDPNREETSLLHASLLEKAGRVDEARREVRALAVRRPTSAPAWRALRDLAVRTKDKAAADQASERLAQIAGAGGDPGGSGAASSALEAVDAALSSNDLTRARRLGQRARISPAELAVRAAALGRFAAAKEQAELVLGADPSEGSARIALAVAADLSGDSARLSDALADVPPSSAPLAPPSPLARLLFAELLDRRAGLSAAQAWLGPLRPKEAATTGGDTLLNGVEDRVRARAGRAGAP